MLDIFNSLSKTDAAYFTYYCIPSDGTWAEKFDICTIGKAWIMFTRNYSDYNSFVNTTIQLNRGNLDACGYHEFIEKSNGQITCTSPNAATTDATIGTHRLVYYKPY